MSERSTTGIDQERLAEQAATLAGADQQTRERVDEARGDERRETLDRVERDAKEGD